MDVKRQYFATLTLENPVSLFVSFSNTPAQHFSLHRSFIDTGDLAADTYLAYFPNYHEAAEYCHRNSITVL